MSFLSKFRTSSKTKDKPLSRSGLNICILQGKLERYSSDRLNAAMQAAWHRPYEPAKFFGTNLDNEHGLVKFNDFYIPVYFHDRALNNEELNGLSIPSWVDHTSFSKISFAPGGEGLPTAEDRHQFTGLIALLALELANDTTTAFFFVEDQAFIKRDSLTRQVILQAKSFDPNALAT